MNVNEASRKTSPIRAKKLILMYQNETYPYLPPRPRHETEVLENDEDKSGKVVDDEETNE